MKMSKVINNTGRNNSARNPAIKEEIQWNQMRKGNVANIFNTEKMGFLQEPIFPQN
jgi:hypothetical protein